MIELLRGAFRSWRIRRLEGQRDRARARQLSSITGFFNTTDLCERKAYRDHYARDREKIVRCLKEIEALKLP